MKKTKRVAGKKPAIGNRLVNQLLPSQISKQLKKHYANKYHNYSHKSQVTGNRG